MRWLGLAALGLIAACGGSRQPAVPPATTADEPVLLDPDRPLECMTDTDCLAHEIEISAALP